MTRKIALTTLTMLVFAAAPVLGQDKPRKTDKPPCCQAKAKAKAACAQQGKKAACSADAKKSGCCTAGKKLGCKDKNQAACKSEKEACGEINCVGEQVRYKGVAIPRMSYQVGDQKLSCPKSAVKLAKEKNLPIQYVVAGKTYTDKAEALAAHAAQLEKYYNELLTVRYAVGDQCVACPNAAAQIAKEKGAKVCYQVGSFRFEDKQAAEKAAKMARAQGERVKIKCMVGDQVFDSPARAAEVAKTAGKPVTYCVGKLNTTSETVAKIQLQVARIKSALDTIAKSGGKQVASR